MKHRSLLLRLLICAVLPAFVVSPVILPVAAADARAEPENRKLNPGRQKENVSRFMDRLFDPQKYTHACTARTPAEFAAWLAETRPAFSRLLKLDVIAADAPNFKASARLDPKIEDLGAFTRQEGWITTEPEVEIQFWILRPKGAGPFPLAVTANGHGPNRGTAGIYLNEQEKERTLREDRDVGVQAVLRGFVAIVSSTRGIARNPQAFAIEDIDGRHEGVDCVCHNMHAIVAGRSLMGERVWDIMRIIDWAHTLPEVDRTNVFMTGNSGGGMLTYHAAAVDERITIAAPSSSFDDYFKPYKNLTHCPCNYFPGMTRFSPASHIGGLVAPRHLLTVTGIKDRAHPKVTVDKAAAELKKIFEAAGVPERYEHRYGPAGHRFYKDLMWDFVSQAMGRDLRGESK